ncbi:glycerol-3-phosphate 1-O-acyltransferase PlsY [Anaerovorax odorimutans]|uniref:Glycerol-3-phosphate acyltransferase n=1 Tax=Anaerovorax odorimutans TaxID=109327 RepID=A0ABT1RK34_9FIRM|nr:glycerol-3-phosphate 1-O-acyltransferase PlsY [Anaerovorax odorimutans]MCQ4635538.1 glycerol-3-phosphate 1-O-acyltransferase PlsY [Anaerovorax odorimutans]
MFDASIGVIGGADGPTQVYATGDMGLVGQFFNSGGLAVDSVNTLLIIYYIIFAFVVLLAYFIGNISPSIMLAKRHGIDIKKAGSGNAGTTNALRVLGKKAGVLTLVVDILKGVVSVLLGGLICGHGCAMLCVMAVMFGHIWPIVYRFKGGKGVATAFGALLGLNPLLGLSALGVVIVGVLVSQRMSVGSMLGALSFPVLCIFLEKDFIYLGIVLALIILIKHRANIKRLFKGEEPKLSIFDKEKKR